MTTTEPARVTDATPTLVRRGGGDSRYAEWPLSQRMKYADMLSNAADLIPRGLFDKQTGRPSAAKIFLVLETGTMLGLHPMAALQGIDVIEGSATITPRLFTGLVRAAGHRLRIVEDGTLETGNYKVTVTLVRHDDPDYPITASWTPHQALRAGLIDKYEVDPRTGLWKLTARSKSGNVLPWEAYTEDMCLWRALGRLGRKGAADVLMGIGYMPDELMVEVGEDGARAALDTGAEAALIERIRATDDKADMETIWREGNPLGEPVAHWTDRVQAEFDSQLMRCTKDSRPPRDGAPGNTGARAIDAPAASPTQPDAVPAQAAEPDVVTLPAVPPAEPVSGATAAAVFAGAPSLLPPDEDEADDADDPDEAEFRRFEAEAAAEHAAWIASQQNPDGDA